MAEVFKRSPMFVRQKSAAGQCVEVWLRLRGDLSPQGKQRFEKLGQSGIDLGGVLG
ncbi:hypothetical protein [Neorhizobium galegae]|uniref:hypothetical protein n=1 Tax=Neorhizobium galegae TaxID=399 RepID=UPI002034DFE9|nr:hypothetical protein [Neorhizobium galegae]MCM2496515.1 hypothetical protein [Neorhizobium galegae]MCQ1770332.1 hypothetical protein [Neorhizobium galegae]